VPESEAGARVPTPAGGLAFLTGCGRSGTTILGRVIAADPGVRYLNDRFEVWVGPLPQSDAWGLGGGAGGRVELTEADADDSDRARFREAIERHRCGRALVVDKIALNNFRLRFLAALAPGAPIVTITRHGVEVARSIARRIECGQWYGVGDRKWALLRELAEGRGLGELASRCVTPVERGLLEWRLSVEVAAERTRAIEPARLLMVRYEELLADPRRVALRVGSHLGVADGGRAMADWAQGRVARRTPPSGTLRPPREVEAIAGDTLRALGYDPAGGVLDGSTLPP